MTTTETPAVKQAFDLLPGLPSRDDAEVGELMDVVSPLSREGVDEIARCLLRAALGYRRTGSAVYLVTLAEDSLVTIGLRADPELDRALREAPVRPAAPEDSVDVEEMLRQRGL
jgi:hypothetical protein